MGEENVSLKVTAQDASQSTWTNVKKAVDGIDKSVKTLRETFGDLGRLMSAGAAFAGFKAFIDQANEAEGVAKRFKAVFSGIEEEATAMATGISKAFGLTVDQAQEQLTSFSLILQNLGFTKKAALGMSEAMVGLSNDMASFAQVPVAEATRAIEMAMMGATKGLKEFGIMIDQDMIKEEALRQGLGNTKGELSQLERAYVTQALILKNAATVTGDYAKNQESYNNLLAKFKGQMGETGETIGKFFLPKISEILKLFLALPDAVKIVVAALPPLILAFTALGGPLTIAVTALTALTWVAAKIKGAYDDAAKSTEKYVDSLETEAELLPVLENLKKKAVTATEAKIKAERTYLEVQTESNRQYYLTSANEEMRIKMLINKINDKLAAIKKAAQAEIDTQNKLALEEARLAKEKADREQAAEDRKKALQKKREAEAEAAKKKEQELQTFIADMRVEVVESGYKQELAKLQKWHDEKYELVKGNLEGEALLQQEFFQKKKELVDADILARSQAADAEWAKIQELEAKKTEAQKNSAIGLAKNLQVIGGTFKEMFGLAKAGAIAEATIAGYNSVVQAYEWGTAAGGPIAGAIFASIAGIAQAINVAKVAAVPPPFQTAADQVRTIPGPSTRPMLITAHGGEKVGRGGQGVMLNVNVSGSIFNSDEVVPAIANALREYQKQTGYQLSPA